MNLELLDIAALHALGLADRAEGDLLLAHGEDPQFQAEVDALERVAGRLAEWSAIQPPPALKNRLLAQIGATASAEKPVGHGVLAMVRANEGKWQATPFPGITMKTLFYDRASGNQSVLVRMEPGSVYPNHHHKGLEHSLVLEGDAIFSDHTLYAGDYEVGAVDHDHSSITTRGGCLVFIMHNRSDVVYAV